jgi:hypothetical protein
MSLQELLAQICLSAKAQAKLYKSQLDAIYELRDNPATPFSLFELPLVTDPVKGRAYELDRRDSGDVLVGFIADTDASFTLVAHADTKHEFPVAMAAGDFQLAWRNEAPFPCIRIVYHNLYSKDLKGGVRAICACLNSPMRRELVQRNIMSLGSTWITGSGMMGPGVDPWPDSVR